MASRRLILSLNRRSHPGARLDWRWSDTTERFQQQPESRVEIIVFPCQVDLVMARAAAEIPLFVGLVRIEMAAAVRRHAVDPASMFLVCDLKQKMAQCATHASNPRTPNYASSEGLS